jgi:hypothetical protein
MIDTDLSQLVAELDNWSGDGGPATFWWRDDDAGSPCSQLDALLDTGSGRPLALATIPAAADAALAQRLAHEPQVTIFQHGWAHQNHASQGPNSEYPSCRSIAVVENEFIKGRETLTRLFGDQFLPVFAPPWHGLDHVFLPALKRAGILGLSTKGRRKPVVATGLIEHNVHCVPISWSAPPTFGNPQDYVAQLVEHLRERRTQTDRSEATGILTHHLVQPDDSFEFLSCVLDLIDDHPAAHLVGARELFATVSGIITR